MDNIDRLALMIDGNGLDTLPCTQNNLSCGIFHQSTRHRHLLRGHSNDEGKKEGCDASHGI